jgi:hypothetical protein
MRRGGVGAARSCVVDAKLNCAFAFSRQLKGEQAFDWFHEGVAAEPPLTDPINFDLVDRLNYGNGSRSPPSSEAGHDTYWKPGPWFPVRMVGNR